MGRVAEGRQDVRATRPDVPWPKMAGFRDVAVRFYFGLSLAILWDIVHEQVKSVLPVMRSAGEVEQNKA